jgi:hypothetical protein
MKITYCFISPIILSFSLGEKGPQFDNSHIHEITSGCFSYLIHELMPERQ